MKKYISVFIVLLTFAGAKAQQLPLYSQYVVNDFLINPAVAGKNPYFEVKTTARYQWIGVNDAPRTYVLSLNGPWKGKNMGFGGYIFNDVTGPTRRTGGTVSYAYHLKLTETMKLGLGLSGGLLQYTVDGGKILMSNNGDPALSNGNQQVLIPDFGFGAHLYTDTWFFGISTPQILNNKLKFFDYTSTPLSQLVTHIYAVGGYKFKINDNYTIEPTIAAKYSYPAPMQLDISVRAIYKEKIWAGFTYRTLDALSMLVGYSFDDNVLFGYSYDYPITNIAKYTTGSHELMLAFRFNKGTIINK